VRPAPDFLDVPKPAAVAALPITGAGLPVPFTTLYRPDDGRDVRYTVSATRGPMCACKCKFGIGRALIGVQCVNRQRRAMRNRLCGVCGQSLHTGDDIIFVGQCEPFAPDGAAGPTIPATVEAPTHPACTVYSALTCPSLMRDPDTTRLAVMSQYDLADQLLTGYNTRGEPRYVLAPQATNHRLLGALNSYAALLHPENGRLTTLGEWMRDEAPALS